jgi:hypothetical protein
MPHKIMNDTDPVVGFNPVTHDKPAPGGQRDNTPPAATGFGATVSKYIQDATGMSAITKALSGGK